MAWIEAEYGSRRGLARLAKANITRISGGFGPYQHIDFARVSHLVFVCKGNICRSAYAGAYASHLGISAASCGIEAREGDFANPRVLGIAGNRHIELGAHRTRRLDQQHFGAGDLLVGMEPVHLVPMHAVAGSSQLTLLGLWGVPQRPYIHDPYSASDAYLLRCLLYIETCVRVLIDRIRSHQAVPGKLL
jgi:protein-tyrosine phosphatase